jgi:hypothetical protein
VKAFCSPHNIVETSFLLPEEEWVEEMEEVKENQEESEEEEEEEEEVIRHEDTNHPKRNKAELGLPKR